MYGIRVGISKLLLNSPVVPLDESVDLRASWINEKMRNLVFCQLLVKLPQVLSAIVCLPDNHFSRIDAFESKVKILHVSIG